MRTLAFVAPSLVISLALTGCALLQTPRESAPTPVARGHLEAIRHCAACHAVELGGVSPHPRAAAFASGEMQHTAGIEGRVAALTQRGHYDMKPLELSGQQVEDIVAYIASLEDPGGRTGAEAGAVPQAEGFRPAALLVAAQGAGPEQDPAGSMELGRRIVESKCGRCHGIGASDASLHPVAPALRDLSERYDVEALGESLAEGILTGHPDMPEFRFEAPEIESILRYLKSLQLRQRGERPPTPSRGPARAPAAASHGWT
ncbi:c-type cytochrome [Phenylobacterium sp.]|uniref:c-type cytochrome n=1 Tax=Phenylobacterium sp. TaxID=1871053 RepID=UPI00286B7866|nr:c-type cytochrome [Phenylobacterium sp.]